MPTVPEMLRQYARSATGPSSPLYTALLTSAADDVEAGGPAAAVLAGHDGDTMGSALPLRLLAAVHRLVLERQAPEVALSFPSVGGTAPVDQAWPAVRRLLAERPDAVRAYLELPCQTNEVARSTVLLAGLLTTVPDRPVRLLEVGASAGLNLRVDAYRYSSPVGGWGPVDSPVRFEDPWAGGAPPLDRSLRIVERRGCDLSPIDPTTEAGRMRLVSHVWADQIGRFERLRGALAVAATVPAPVDAADLVDWLGERLAVPAPGVTTVVWQSVVRPYLPASVRTGLAEALAAAGTRASAAAPLVHLSMEAERGSEAVPFALRATRWPGGETGHLADATGHGPPVVLRAGLGG